MLARSAARFAAKAEWEDGKVKARTQVGVVLWRMGRTRESVAIFEAFAPEEWSSTEAGRSLLSYGFALRSAGNYRKSEEILLLCRFQELKYEEIGRILGCEVGTVKTRVHRALQDLRVIYLGLESGASANERNSAGAKFIPPPGSQQ